MFVCTVSHINCVCVHVEMTHNDTLHNFCHLIQTNDAVRRLRLDLIHGGIQYVYVLGFQLKQQTITFY